MELLMNSYGDQIRAFNEDSYSTLMAFIDSLKRPSTLRWGAKHDLSDMYDVFDSMATIESFLDKTLSIISTLRHQKYDADLNASTAIVRDRIHQYRAQRVEQDPKILELIKHGNVEETCAFVLTRRANKLSIYLISLCFPQASPMQQKRLIAFVEAQKNKLLSCETRIKDCAELPATQSFICRYNLFGATPSYGAVALFKYFGAWYDESKSFEENLGQLANSVIIINSTSLSPVEYTLASLIDEKYITENKLVVSATAGINTTLIKKMQTVRLLPTVEDMKPAGPPLVFAKGEHLPWYVLETLNGKTHRVLGKYTVGGVSIVHEYNDIKGLFEGPTARPHMYNAIQSDRIMKNYKPDLRIIRDAFSRRPTLKFNTDLAKANSVESLVAWYEGAYNSSFVPTLWSKKGAHETRSKYAPEPVSGDKDITSAEKRIGIFVRRLIRFTGEFTRDHEACAFIMKIVTEMYSTGPNTDEDIVTRLVQYDIIVTTFHQEFDRLWDSSLPVLQERLRGALVDASINDHDLTLSQTFRLAMMVVLDILRACWTAAVDHLDRSKQWTEYGSSIKLFTIHA